MAGVAHHLRGRVVKMRAAAAALLVAAVAALAGCGGGGVKAGTVFGKTFSPAHNETGLRQQYVGQSCSKVGSSNICTSRYITLPYTYFVPASYGLRVRDCRTQDSSGNRKCETGVAYVDETTWHSMRVGSYYSKNGGK